ncbi:phage major capsid protein [Streptomyces sp. LS1784]|uniref:phage major capsid protein n=1 Tax=Streptomyces sp. LS1784 TaxID=2851533 RepID=UPI001CC91192|nr:phage major capsid protein [Streptomyces sp. LS1784]
MNLRQQLKAALDRLAELSALAKAENRDFTEEEVTEVTELSAKADDLDGKIKAADAAQASVARLTAKGDRPAPVLEGVSDRTDEALGSIGGPGGLGEQFVKSAAYQTFRSAHPSGFGEGTPIQLDRVKVGSLADLRGGFKADAPVQQVGLGRLQNVRLPTVDLTTPMPLTILDLIDHGTIGGPSFEYLQITAVTRNAALVPDEILPADATTKPTSGLSTNLATAKVYTYADGYTVTNQMLADAPALASYLNGQLSYNISNVIEDKILNGSGTGGNPTGILATSGVQNQAFDTDMVTTIRKAITRLENISAPITAVLVSPSDNEKFDLLKDAQGRYYSQGPWGSGPGTIWGRPRVVSQRLPSGTAILGNWKTVSLMDREGLSVLAFNQHKDYAARNLVYVRAELRAAQAVFKPAELCIAALA